MKYTFEFKLGCVERYKQARMRPSARKQKQKFLQIPRPALGEPGRLDEAERKKIKGHLCEMYPKVWTDISLRLEGIFHEVDV